MGSSRNVLYGFASSLLLFAGVVAIEQSYLKYLDSAIASPRAGGDSGRGSPRVSARVPAGRGSSVGEEESWAGAAQGDGQDDPRERSRRVPRWENPGALGSRSVAMDPASQWWNRKTFSTDETGGEPIPAAPLDEVSFGSGAPAAESAVPARPSQGPVSNVFFGESEATACQPGPREFVLEEVRDLSVCIVWSRLSGTYAAQLTFLSPDGNVYQTMTLGFVTPNAAPTVATLPVAGTYITQHSLAGRWGIRISLEEQSVDQDSFTLAPRT